MLVSSRFSLLLVLFWWGFAACASVSQAASSLEGVMRAYQERYQVVKSANKTWPANAAGEVAPVFPPDGFYARSITGPASQTAYDTLRSSIADNMFDGVNGVTTPADELMSGWLTNGDLEGSAFSSLFASNLREVIPPTAAFLTTSGKEEAIVARLSKMKWRGVPLVAQWTNYHCHRSL